MGSPRKGRPDPLPQWVTVGHDAPRTQVRTWLHGLDEPLDVSANHVPVDLHPLTVAIALSGEGRPELAHRARQTRLWLTVEEPEPSGKLLGRVGLKYRQALPLGETDLYFFDTDSYENFCLPRIELYWNYLRERIKLFFDHDPRNVHKMTPAQLFAMWVLYIAPRPVGLVSYDHEGKSNLLPMDLMGETDSPYYLLGLHTTSPATPVITRARKLAISHVPFEDKDVVFSFGRHHRQVTIDWDQVPFPVEKSRTFGLPVPQHALDVREVVLEESLETGRHTLFVTTTVDFEERHRGLQMCHVHRLYQCYLRSQGRELVAYNGEPGD